jgi:hypothetical protein
MIKDKLPIKLGATREVEEQFLKELRDQNNPAPQPGGIAKLKSFFPFTDDSTKQKEVPQKVTEGASPFTDDSATRKEYPVYSGCLNYFPDAIGAIAKQTLAGMEGSNEEIIADSLKCGDWATVALASVILLQRKINPDRQGVSLDLNLYSFMLWHADALAAICHLSKEGNDKHNPGEPLHWSRDKSNDHKDCIARHLIDGDWVELAWRALANLQIELENGYDISKEMDQYEPELPDEEFDEKEEIIARMLDLNTPPVKKVVLCTYDLDEPAHEIQKGRKYTVKKATNSDYILEESSGLPYPKVWFKEA